MTEPASIVPDPDRYVDADDTQELPVAVDLEQPEVDVVDQSMPVVLDVEGHSFP